MAPEDDPKVRLTRTGTTVLIAGALVVVAGRLTGVEEFSLAGGFLLLLVGVATLLVRLAGADVDVERGIRPRRVMVGSRCLVGLRVHNGRNVLRLPLTVVDHLDGEALAPLTLGQRRGDPAVDVEYDLPARRRGVARFGPMRLRVVDPFGLAGITRTIDHRVDVIMLPRLVPLDVGPAPGTDDASEGLRHRRMMVDVGDEFESLREYAPGDDVRRVHWASTARLGRPMVRNHQQPSQRRTTVVLDDRVAAFPRRDGAAPFERAVSAAASVLDACRRRGDLVRLVTTSGLDTGTFDDRQRFDAVLDQLAALHEGDVGSLAATIGAVTVSGAGDRLVACVGGVEPEALAALGRTAGNRCRVVVVSCAATAPALVGAPGGRASAEFTTVDYGDGVDLAAVWPA